MIFRRQIKWVGAILNIACLCVIFAVITLYPMKAYSDEEGRCQTFSLDSQELAVLDEIVWGAEIAPSLLEQFLQLDGRNHGNPYVHLSVGLDHLSAQRYDLSLAHLELASYIVATNDVCHEPQLSELLFLMRRQAFLELISSSQNKWMAESLTSGLTLPNTGLDTASFERIEQCLVSWLQRIRSSASENFCEKD